MPVIASFFAAAVPMLIYLMFLWWMDKYDREPVSFVLLHFLWGAFGAVLLGITGSMVLVVLTGELGDSSNSASLIRTIIFAPLSEEFAKGSFLLLTINSKKIDNIMDGLVYGGAIGLGFGMTENFIYFLTYGNSLESWLQIVLIRSLFSAVMHCISTGSFGAMLAIFKFSSSRLRNILPLSGIALAILIHFLWNYLVSFEETYSFGFIFMFFLILLFYIVLRLSMTSEKRIIERELLEESKMDILPESHIKILSSHLRYRRGWIDERIRVPYTRSAIRLAFNKNQYKCVNDSLKDCYAIEIEKSRESVRSLFTLN